MDQVIDLMSQGRFEDSRNLSCLNSVEFAGNDGRKLKDYFTKPLEFTSTQLREFTDDFSERNFIGPTQFGDAYRGKIRVGTATFDVTVKMWNENSDSLDNYEADHIFVAEEVMFLTDPEVASHPNLPLVVGYCCEETITGIVYDLKPMDSLHNTITRDDFGWSQRIKVALGFARLLQFLHSLEKPYMIRNIDAHHVMLDDECNPFLFDFGLLSGGFIGGLSFIKQQVLPAPGYYDPRTCPDQSTLDSDVFCYGVVLIGLLSKRVFDLKKRVPGERVVSVDEWAEEEYKDNPSLVHKSLEGDPGFYAPDALLITELGMRCIQRDFQSRPTMGEVVDSLLKFASCLGAC